MVLYSKILKQAFEITRQYKFLWIFGLFLTLGIVYFFLEERLRTQTNMPLYLNALITAAVILFVIRNAVALIVAIKAVTDKVETSYSKAFQASKLFFGRVLIVSILIDLVLIVIAFLLLTPTVYLFDQQLTSKATILSVVALIIFIPTLIVGFIIGILSPLFIIVYDFLSKESVQKAFEFLSKHWYPLTSLLILLIILDLPALFLAQFVLGLRGGLVIPIFGGLIFLIFQTWYVVYSQTVWYLVFKDLIRPQKLEQEEPVVLPEIAG